MSYVVRGLKPSDNSPPENEYGGAFNNDLVAVCSSKPVKSERLNHKHQQSAPELPYRITARDGISRIVNGIETTPHQYPFMVAILADESFFCGGSLIDQNHVLTSASCIDQYAACIALTTNTLKIKVYIIFTFMFIFVFSSQRIDLFFGVYNMSNRAENWYARQVRTIQFPDIANSVFIHPKYQSKSGANDIAILRVNSVKVTSKNGVNSSSICEDRLKLASIYFCYTIFQNTCNLYSYPVSTQHPLLSRDGTSGHWDGVQLTRTRKI
jgi:hypothetical protein